MKKMTVEQFLNTVDRRNKVYLQSTRNKKGEELVEVTNYIRGSQCVRSWEVFQVYTLENGDCFVLQVDLPPAAVAALEQE